MNFRPASLKDLGSCMRIRTEAFQAIVEESFGKWDVDFERAKMVERLTEGGVILIESEDCLPIAYYSSAVEDGRLWLHNVFVLPTWQGKGVGSEVLRRIEGASSEMKLPASLRVLFKNTNAIQFYRNRGWSQYLESETHIYFGWPPNPN